MNNPEGYVLVQVKQLAQWREWANNVAAWSTKSDRSSEVARLKASISGAMVSATQPTASNAGEREALKRIYYFQQDLGNPPLASVAEQMREIARAALSATPPAQAVQDKIDAERWRGARESPLLLFERWDSVALPADGCDAAVDEAIRAARTRGNGVEPS